MKDPNFYASTVAFPEYVTEDIASLDRPALLNAQVFLLQTIRDPDFPLELAAFGTLGNETLNWLRVQSVDTLKDLSRWLITELL